MKNKDKDGYEYFQFISINGIVDTPIEVKTVPPEQQKETVTIPVSNKKEKVYSPKIRYSYEGPIYQWDRCVVHCFKTVTAAVTEARAIQNILYKAKCYMDLSPGAGGFKLKHCCLKRMD